MTKLTHLFFLIGVFALCYSCKSDDNRSCVTCSSSQTPAFEVCEENDGTASVNGEYTGTSFDVYVAGLEAAGASCGN